MDICVGAYGAFRGQTWVPDSASPRSHHLHIEDKGQSSESHTSPSIQVTPLSLGHSQALL